MTKLWMIAKKSKNKITESAFGWTKKAARQGLAKAQYQVGLLYARGNGVKQNFGEAYSWFEKAADKKLGIAHSAMGQLLEAGKGVDRDILGAIVLHRKAKSLGNEFAQKYIDRLIRDDGDDKFASEIQQRLKDLGYYDGVVDGDFGSGSKAALKAYCKC